MSIKYVATVILVISLINFNLHAQVIFEFIEDKHDFGFVDEGTNARWDFKFINKGKDTIRLQENDVRASCGCTTPFWTRDPIAPGETGTISAQYNSTGRPGIFNKSVTVSYNGGVVKILTIKGIVVKPDTIKYEEADLKKSPKIVLDKTNHNFGKVERGQRVLTKINVKNTGKDTLKILNGQSACSCVTYKLLMEKKDKTTFEVKDVPPSKNAILELVYSAQGDGKNTDIITFTTNDLSNKRIPITLTAEVVPSLQENSILIENKSNAPFGNK